MFSDAGGDLIMGLQLKKADYLDSVPGENAAFPKELVGYTRPPTANPYKEHIGHANFTGNSPYRHPAACPNPEGNKWTFYYGPNNTIKMGQMDM